MTKKHQRKENGLRPSHDPWQIAEAILGISRRVLLRGKPGTGKTYAASKLGLRPDQKVYQVTMTPETPMAEIRGHFIQVGGEFVWHDGPAISAWREGARLVINEIDRASEDVHSLLYAIMDDPEFAELTLPSGETVRPATGFGLVATMNGVPDDLPDALQDRLPVDIEITDLAQGAIDRLPEDLRAPARNTALAKSEERSISVRMWMEFASLREKLQDEEGGLQIAAYAVFGEKAEAAMTALTIGASASEPIDAQGNPINSEMLDALRTCFEWITAYKATRAGTVFTGLEVETVREEVRNITKKIEAMGWANGEPVIFSVPEDLNENNTYIKVGETIYTDAHFVMDKLLASQ